MLKLLRSSDVETDGSTQSPRDFARDKQPGHRFDHRGETCITPNDQLVLTSVPLVEQLPRSSILDLPRYLRREQPQRKRQPHGRSRRDSASRRAFPHVEHHEAISRYAVRARAVRGGH